MNGETLQAEVVEYQIESRAEITYGHVKVRATSANGNRVEEVVPLPLSLLYSLGEKQALDVRYLPGSRRPIIVEEVGRAQWRLALINSGMAFMGFILLVIGVGGWNLYLHRHGDPSAMSTQDNKDQRYGSSG